jgi:hypothetical protein
MKGKKERTARAESRRRSCTAKKRSRKFERHKRRKRGKAQDGKKSKKKRLPRKETFRGRYRKKKEGKQKKLRMVFLPEPTKIAPAPKGILSGRAKETFRDRGQKLRKTIKSIR